jgi:hypothetical protein
MPYNQYSAHFCLGAIYSRSDKSLSCELNKYNIENLESIVSVIKDFQFFVCEKWEIASDSQGSGNTANIGSIVRIEDILAAKGVFYNLGEEVFDDYWTNYGRMMVKDKNGKRKKMTKISEFCKYKRIDPSLINPCIRSSKTRKTI